jgi:hypothetical protein
MAPFDGYFGERDRPSLLGISRDCLSVLLTSEKLEAFLNSLLCSGDYNSLILYDELECIKNSRF